jgi:hypothetical protein
MTTCRELGATPPVERKDGRLWITNRYPAWCRVCRDRLEPGEAMVGGKDAGGIRWICGARRWTRS